MGADRSYVERNRRELERLRALVGRASDQDLERPMEDGWTVASVLAHMAFWDLRVATCLERWGPDGGGPEPTYHDDAVDWINDSTKPLISALEPRVAARLAIEAAEAADRSVAEMSEALLERNGPDSRYVNIDRTEHRAEHLDEIELLLTTS